MPEACKVIAYDDDIPNEEVARTKDSTSEVRVTSETGASKNSKAARFDMIPADVLYELAEHYGIGAEKYPPFRKVDLPLSTEAIHEAVGEVCDCGSK